MDTNAPLDQVEEAQKSYFAITRDIPEEAWYWAAIGSVVASATLWLAGKRDWSTFVGQWPPTFLLLGLFHRRTSLGRN